MLCGPLLVEIPVEIPVPFKVDGSILTQKFHFNTENFCHDVQRHHSAVYIKLLSALAQWNIGNNYTQKYWEQATDCDKK